MFPRDGIGGVIPAPIKLNPASDRIIEGIERREWERFTGRMWGRK